MILKKKPSFFLKTKELKADEQYSERMSKIDEQLEYIKNNHPLDFLSDLLFPHLVGSEWNLIRRCFLLLLVSQNTPDSNARIGLNMLLVGTPGTGKTEMLTWNELHMGIDMINAEYTTKVGLCADARGKEISPGFLPNHTGKVVGIDELDKMKHEDQNGLLQAMEEGKFTVVKGKYEQNFDAEIRATATCNEIEKIMKPLFDRFDFIFRVHQSNRQQRANQSRKIVEQFFNLPDRTNAMIIQRYLDWIKDDVTKYESDAEMVRIQDVLNSYILQTKTNIDKVSYRSLELSFIRIAYSLARLERKQITVDHMKQAITLKDMILKSFVGVT